MKVEQRRSLFYGKYKYKAALHLLGANRLYHVTSMLTLLQLLEKQLLEGEQHLWSWNHRKSNIAELDLDHIERFIDWKNQNHNKHHRPKTMMIRYEQRKVCIFSNDVVLLETLRSIDPGDPNSVTIVEVDTCMPQGVLTLKNPKHKFRVYFKGRAVPETFKLELHEFIDRYKGTRTEVYPCPSLRSWLGRPRGSWYNTHSSAGFFVEYDEDSTHVLLSFMFGKMLARRFDLIKRT